MPAELHEHPDGYVYVRAGGVTYADTAENFVADFSETLPPMPAGADDHIYTQDRRHAWMGDGNVIEGGPIPWPQGDRIIANLAAGIAAQDARLASLPPPEPQDTPNILYDHENRLRVLEGQPPLTLEDFNKKVRGA